jgi:hypothetical protein
MTSEKASEFGSDRSTYERQRIMQVRVIQLDGNVMDPRLNSIGPPFSCRTKESERVTASKTRNLRIIVDLKTKEPPARSLLNRADHEFPSLGSEVSRGQ